MCFMALTDGRIAPRSGLAWKKHIDVGAGVIDADCKLWLFFVANQLLVLFDSSTRVTSH